MSALSPCRLLIVEDGADDRMAYRIMLKQRASRELAVTIAASGEEGLAALHAGSFDCMLLDHDLPDMTGLEMLDHAMHEDGHSRCPTIMVTGNQNEQIAAAARHLGVQAVLLKDDLDNAKLRHAIDSAIAASDPPDPAGPAGDGALPAAPIAALTIAAAKLGLAATFGVAPDNLEIIIHA